MPRKTLEKQVWTRLTVDDFDRVEKVAAEMGLSTSAFVRQAVIDALDEIESALGELDVLAEKLAVVGMNAVLAGDHLDNDV